MNLDPTVSPWLGILASIGVCLWMVAIGMPLAHAVFRDRPRLVWPFYAPALGIVVVLLTTNLSAYVIPGAPSAWFGLVAPSGLAALVAWRTRPSRLPLRRAALAALALCLASAGTFLMAFASRTQVRPAEEAWHYALTLRMARGVFPPVTPYGQDAGIGYHYGPDLLAASIVNTAAVPPWTASVVLTAVLVVALVLAAVGFAWDLGAPRPLAVGAGAVLGLIIDPLHVGLPPYVQTSGESAGRFWLVEGLASPQSTEAFEWVHKPHWALALCIVLLVAAALQMRAGRRQAVLIAAAAGVMALAEAAVMIFASIALGMIGISRLLRLRGRDRLLLAAALAAAALLIALAGGPVSDALWQRGGTTGQVRIAFGPNWDELAPFELTGPALVRLGIVPLLAVAALAAFRKRSWGIAFLAAAGGLGLLEALVLQSPLPGNDARILFLASAVAAVAALTGVSVLTPSVPGWKRNSAILAVLLLGLLPTVVPRAIAGVRSTTAGFVVEQPVRQGPGYPYVGETRFASELDANWDFYQWLATALPNDARLLTPYPAVATSVAGVASPTSGRGLQILSARGTPVYRDALRFLHADDLTEMSITHLHVTDRLEEALSSQARDLLDDSAQFRLMADVVSVTGERHRVFEVMPGAGTREVSESSYRRLSEVAPQNSSVYVLSGLTGHQRSMLLFTLIDHGDLNAPGSFLDRATRNPRYDAIVDTPTDGVVALLDHIEPTALRLTRDDAIWAGYGMRVYDLDSVWSSVWRVGSGFEELPVSPRQACEASADGLVDLRLLGEPGTVLTAGTADVDLSGVPQVTGVSVRDCRKLALTAHAPVASFAQLRPAGSGRGADAQTQVAGLGFDGANEAGLAIVNLWYRNPHGLPFSSGMEFRLYRAGRSGVVPLETDPRESVRWWSAPLTLALDSQMARIEFDPRQLTVNGDPGVPNSDVTPGRTNLLALNVSRFNAETASLWIQQVIPLVRFEVRDTGISSQVFSGIVGIEHREAGGPSRWLDYTGIIGWEIDLTPWPESPEPLP